MYPPGDTDGFDLRRSQHLRLMLKPSACGGRVLLLLVIAVPSKLSAPLRVHDLVALLFNLKTGAAQLAEMVEVL